MKNFGKGYWKTFEQGIQREWVVTNGIGGYAGDSIIGAHTRKHHGLLIASLRPPVERYLMVSRIEETIKIGEQQYCLGANQRHGGVYEEGQKYLQRFQFDAVPTYVYHVEDFHLTKTIAMEYGHNTTAIGYEIQNGGHATTIKLVPFFNYREHGEGSQIEDLNFASESHMEGSGVTLCLVPLKNEEVKIRLYSSAGTVMQHGGSCYDMDLELQTEIDTGMSSIDNNFAPYSIEISLEPYEKKKIAVIASVEDDYNKNAFEIIEAARNRSSLLEDKAKKQVIKKWNILETAFADSLFGDLVKAADCFIVDRQSTGYKTILAGLPWFTDWGRDTMIAMQGLTLVTGRLDDAKGILKTFAQYVQNGLVPNMFPDEGLEPLYNTVDASLWYFHSVDQYLNYADSQEAYDFVQKEIYPKLKEIMKAYQTGTLFSIYMDEDGLLHAGGDLDQVTWMDVRVDEWVVTPRHGKPVEINALWYNGVKVMEDLTLRFEGEKAAAEYTLLAERIKSSFCHKFWNETTSCLCDVVDEEIQGVKVNNEQIRPNQIYAVSLPHAMLPKEQEKMVVDTVFSHLYATYGLRSLSPSDPEYKGIYKGSLHDRDAAYHQGTAWAFPLGAFITAYVKVNDHSKESILYAKQLLESIEDHLRDGCINQIAEIFDGDEPHISRGCYGQAWSVGEILRAYTEDILAYI